MFWYGIQEKTMKTKKYKIMSLIVNLIFFVLMLPFYPFVICGEIATKVTGWLDSARWDVKVKLCLLVKMPGANKHEYNDEDCF
jgi:hypothetical protein